MTPWPGHNLLRLKLSKPVIFSYQTVQTTIKLSFVTGIIKMYHQKTQSPVKYLTVHCRHGHVWDQRCYRQHF